MASGIEYNEGRSLNVGDGSAEATRVFRLEGYADELAVVRNALGSTISKTGSGVDTVTIPKIRDKHPGFSVLYAYAYNLRKMPGTTDSWEVEFSYRRYQPISQTSSTGLETGPEEVGFTELTARCTGAFHDVYRANPNIPLNGEPDDNDIGGKGVDCAGVPTSVMRQQYEITFSVTDNERRITEYGESVGLRCQTDVFGLDGAAVLYRGASIQRIGTNLFSVQHTYLYDSMYHLIQAPSYHKDGQPNMDYTTGKFKEVTFVQPFPAEGPDPARFVPSNI